LHEPALELLIQLQCVGGARLRCVLQEGRNLVHKLLLVYAQIIGIVHCSGCFVYIAFDFSDELFPASTIDKMVAMVELH